MKSIIFTISCILTALGISCERVDSFNFNKKDILNKYIDTTLGIEFKYPKEWFLEVNNANFNPDSSGLIAHYDLYNYNYNNLPKDQNNEEFNSDQYKYSICLYSKSPIPLEQWIKKDSIKEQKALNIGNKTAIEAATIEKKNGNFQGEETKTIYLKSKGFVVEILSFNNSDKALNTLYKIINSIIIKSK